MSIETRSGQPTRWKRVNRKVKGRSELIRILNNDGNIVRLLGALILETDLAPVSPDTQAVAV